MTTVQLPPGIVSVVQTPFTADGSIDFLSYSRLVDDAVSGGVDGLLAPVVASEVAYLSLSERGQLLKHLSHSIRGRVPLIVGASSDDPETCRSMVHLAREFGAAGCLVAVPQPLYQRLDDVVPFFRRVGADGEFPLIIQDLQFGGTGLPLDMIVELRRQLPNLVGLKIETVPAGPKYSLVRKACGQDFYIAGGWAIPQMIEALDRGVDAMIPESSMVRVYRAIDRLYRSGNRGHATRLFRSLLPVLAFTNQELTTSIAFFKRLLVRKGIFATDRLRIPGLEWDAYSNRIAEDLIDDYLIIESNLPGI